MAEAVSRGLGAQGPPPLAPVYLRGLLGPGERKRVQPMAARVAPADHEQLHPFIATSGWDPARLDAVLAREAHRLVGGGDAVLIIDETALVKQGRHSVGVARQYGGALGKTATYQVLVSLTRARAEVPVPVALRLSLPEAWTADPARCQRAGVPSAVAFGPKWQLALGELDRVRPPTHPRSSTPPVAVQQVIQSLGARAFRRLTWRRGTKGPLTAAFAAVRVRPADGPRVATGRHLPGEPVWLGCERRATGEETYDLTNHPPSASRRTLAAAIKARGVCEQGHHQLTDELGLDHVEGRSWLGLPHHAVLTDARLGLPAALAAAAGPGGGNKLARAAALPRSRPCPPSVASSSRPSRHSCGTAARGVTPGSPFTVVSESGEVVLGATKESLPRSRAL